MYVKSVLWIELASSRVYWREKTANSTTKQHSRHRTKQEKPGEHSWMLLRRTQKMLTPTLNTKTRKLQQKLEKWIGTHSKFGKWLSYQDQNVNFYARETHERYRMTSKQMYK